MEAKAFFKRDWWNNRDYPQRIMDQCFGMRLSDEDVIKFDDIFVSSVRPKPNIMSSSLSEVKNDEKQFTISLGMKQFQPEDIEVKIVDQCVIIQGKYEERKEENGVSSRYFTRRYKLPKGCEAETVTSSLSLDGTLIIVAPKKLSEEPLEEKKNILVCK